MKFNGRYVCRKCGFVKTFVGTCQNGYPSENTHIVEPNDCQFCIHKKKLNKPKKLQAKLNYLQCCIISMVELCEEYEERYIHDPEYIKFRQLEKKLKKKLKKAKKKLPWIPKED